MLNNKSMTREFLKYTVPSVIGMLVSSLYVIIDGIFVGQGVGPDGLAAINITFPFIMFQIAVALIIAAGGANQFSYNKARGINDYANNAFLQSFYLIIIVSLIMNVAALIFLPQFSTLLGTDEILRPSVEGYLKWVAVFGVIFMPGLGLSIFVRNDNAPKLEMTGTLSGAITNIILDYLFIMVFGWGIEGAAVATGIGQIVSFSIYMCHFFKKDRVLAFKKPKWIPKEIRRILITGTPSFLMQFSQSVIAFSYNLILMRVVGAVGVSSYSIIVYITSLFNMVLIGIVSGAQPIMSYNFGKGNTKNIRKIYLITIFTNVVSSIFFYITLIVFGENLISLFAKDNANLLNLTEYIIRYYALAFIPIGISLASILYFQVTGKTKWSILISILRCFGFVQFFLILFSRMFGLTGIAVSFFIGEALNCIISIFLYKKYSIPKNTEDEPFKTLFQRKFTSIFSSVIKK